MAQSAAYLVEAERGGGEGLDNEEAAPPPAARFAKR